MHNRDKGSMLFGIGIGFCVTVAILFVAYVVQRQTYYNRISELNERVYALENMILEAHEGSGALLGSTAIFQEPVTTTAAQGEAAEAEVTAEYDDGYVSEREESNVPEETQTASPESTTTSVQTTNPPADGSVWVHIPANIGAYEIAQILFDMEVVIDFNAFLSYLVENGFTVSLMAGNFLLPMSGDFEAIMSSILAGGL